MKRKNIFFKNNVVVFMKYFKFFESLIKSVKKLVKNFKKGNNLGK